MARFNDAIKELAPGTEFHDEVDVPVGLSRLLLSVSCLSLSLDRSPCFLGLKIRSHTTPGTREAFVLQCRRLSKSSPSLVY